MIIKDKYFMLSIIVPGLLSIVLVLLFLFSIEKTSDIYLVSTRETVYDLKKDFLQDTVNNLIEEIDSRRTAKTESVQQAVNLASLALELEGELDKADFRESVTAFFTENPEFRFFSVLIWSEEEGEAVYDPAQLARGSWEKSLSELLPGLCAYQTLSHKGDKILFGVSKSYVDEQVKLELYDKIRSLRFNNSAYLWINEIIDYQGGKDYAIRRLHPTFPETEGDFLSTEVMDMQGNYPYQIQLEGINKNGEVFFTSFFREPGDETNSERLIFSKHYADFDWVLSMGIYLDDIQAYIDQIGGESRLLKTRLIPILALLFASLLFIGYGLVLIIQNLYHRRTKRQLEDEINRDPMTGADSRRQGTLCLAQAFRDFQQKGVNLAVVMFDVDYFKSINDKYGHTVGDMVLTEAVKSVKGVIRSKDSIIRWGGDEFVVLLREFHEASLPELGKKILTTASTIKIPLPREELSASWSVGLSYFLETDTDFMDAIQRADQALYQSKDRGRNQLTILP